MLGLLTIDTVLLTKEGFLAPHTCVATQSCYICWAIKRTI